MQGLNGVTSVSEIPFVQGPSLMTLMQSMQGKLRIGLGEESVVSALAHAQLLHREGGEDTDGGLANRLERAVQAVKQAVSQCPSYDVLIPALLEFPLEVLYLRIS